MTQNQSVQGRMAWRIQNATTEAEIDIFDIIGDPWNGTTASDFVKELREIKNVSRIILNVNSPGGVVNDALAIFNALEQHPARIEAHVVTAGSAASFVALAADRVLIAKNGKFQIHDAHGLAVGNAADLRALAELMDEESDNIANIYASKAGGTPDEWRKAMQANDGIGTTYRGEAAVEAGLADDVLAAKVSERIAALMPDEPAEVASPGDSNPTTPGTEIGIPGDLGAQFRESASYSPPPTLEELFTKQATQERISVGVGGK